MAKLKNGSTIMRSNGHELIGTIDDIDNIFSTKVKKNNYQIERGRFDPIVRGGNIAGTTNYIRKSGEYIRINDVVFINIEAVVTEMTGEGGLYIYGLPFVADEMTSFSISAFLGLQRADYHQLQAGVERGASFIRLSITSYSTGNRRYVQVDEFTKSELRFSISGTYIRRA